MGWVLWLNTIGETLIAFGMFFAPAQFFPGAEGLPAAIARAFSFAILTVAFISFIISRKGTSKETERVGVTILTAYHLLQLGAQVAYTATFPPMLLPPVVIHIVYSSLFLTYWFKLKKQAA